MIGGPPVAMFPGYAPLPPAYAQQPPAYVQQPPPGFGQQPLLPPGPPQQIPAPPAFAQQSPPAPPAWQPQDAPRTLVRGQMEEQPADAPPPAPRAMPSPEELGVGRPAGQAERVDWNAALGQARRLGATGFHLNESGQGGYRVTLLLPGGGPGRTEHIEATAPTEAAAVRLALERAEQRAARR